MRFTRRGYGLLLGGLLLVAAGFQFGYPELAALGAASAAACVAALAFVAWRPRLTVTRAADPDRVMRGEPSTVRLQIANASRLFGASLVARDRVRPGTGAASVRSARRTLFPAGRSNRSPKAPGHRAPISTAPESSVQVPLARLRPGRVTAVSYAVPTTKRGVIDIGPLEIARRDPLDLVGVVRRYGDRVRVWVRPRAHPITAVPVGLSRSLDGRVDRVPHGSITFAALREYVVGDDLRRVHWRTSARVGELMVREHVDTSLPRIVVLLDDRAAAHSMGPNGESTFEAACEAVASLALAAVREDVHLELRLVAGIATATADSVAHVGPMLDLLAEAELTDDGPSDVGPFDTEGRGGVGEGALWRAVELLRARRLGDTLVYLTGPAHSDDLGIVAGLRGAYPSIIAGVFGEGESALGTNAGMLVVCAVDGADFAAAWDGVRAW